MSNTQNRHLEAFDADRARAAKAAADNRRAFFPFSPEKEKDVSLNFLATLQRAGMASEVCLELHKWITAFDSELDQEHEVGVRLVSFGQSVTFHVQAIGYNDPCMIVFHGLLDDEQPVSLVQHVSQLSFLLTSLKRHDPTSPKQPVGFHAIKEARKSHEDS